MLICIGSCLFTIMGQELITPDRGDPVRIASSIVSGVGFLGAGVIFRRGTQSTGITTAATIWCSAAMGMACGGGRFAIALAAAAGVLVVLWVLPPLERIIDAQREAHTYEIISVLGSKTVAEIHRVFADMDLLVIDCSHGKRDGAMVTRFEVIGKHDAHAAMSQMLIESDWTLEFSS
ncbi:UNVERIFIED_CONTAM: hypothetical protein GTU68_063606 [Idotea baltica]|nr:hypothetical protein [Idotea baltica]